MKKIEIIIDNKFEPFGPILGEFIVEDIHFKNIAKYLNIKYLGNEDYAPDIVIYEVDDDKVDSILETLNSLDIISYAGRYDEKIREVFKAKTDIIDSLNILEDIAEHFTIDKVKWDKEIERVEKNITLLKKIY